MALNGMGSFDFVRLCLTSLRMTGIESFEVSGVSEFQEFQGFRGTRVSLAKHCP
jgi:hypothetical protein